MAKISRDKIVIWLPRVLGLAFVAFLSLFALDVFEYGSPLEIAVTLFMHLIPSFILLAVIAVAWRYELVGAAVFFAGGILYIFLVVPSGHWTWSLFISGPAFLVGTLFLASWTIKKRSQKRGGENGN